MFANCKHEELSYPKNPKNVRPHSSNSIEALLKRQPHYSQVSHENATLSSGTPPLASYKEVPRSPPSPPPHPWEVDQRGKINILYHTGL